MTKTITSTVAFTHVYEYDDGDRLTKVDDQTYTWDANGNLLNDGTRTFAYDAANRLVKVVSGTSTITFTYPSTMLRTGNGDGHRMSKGVDGVTTTYVVALLGLPHVLVEMTGGSSTAYLYGHDLLGEEGTAWTWYLNDGLGSVRQLTDGSGDVTLAQGYTPFGVLLWREGSGASGFGYTGEQEDSDIKLVFLRARYYDPYRGRFLSKDPWPGNVSAPGTLNTWVYVLNNPVLLVDPDGNVGQGPDPEADVCDTWSGLAKINWCLPAASGSLRAKESFYTWLAMGGRIIFGWTVAADILKHYLDATGTPVILDSEWLLHSPEDREQRDKRLSQFVEEYLKPAARSCQTFVEVFLSPRKPKEEHLVVPDTSTDVGVAIGKHWIDGLFSARITTYGSAFDANVEARYQVIDPIDYHPKDEKGRPQGLDLSGRFGIGFVPHQWLIDLRDASPPRAAEFEALIVWTEKALISGSVE